MNAAERLEKVTRDLAEIHKNRAAAVSAERCLVAFFAFITFAVCVWRLS